MINSKKIIKVGLVGIVLILFLISLPAVFTNDRRLGCAETEARVLLDIASGVCRSDCTSYPDDWDFGDQKEEAELYCRQQCADDMEAIRKEAADNLKWSMFESEYSYRVAQVYCLLGLRCLPLELENFIYHYQPEKE